MRIGIFGGSFNPIHSGHIRLAEHAAEELGLDRVFFVPSHQTPLKNSKTILPAHLRVRWIRLALKGKKKFLVSLVEIKRGGISYTVETLRYFKKKFGKKAILYFLAGADTLKNLHRWKKIDEVFRLCRMVAASRPGYWLNDVKYPVILLPFEALEISSSGLRSARSSAHEVPREIKSEWAKYSKYFLKKGGIKNRNQG